MRVFLIIGWMCSKIVQLYNKMFFETDHEALKHLKEIKHKSVEGSEDFSIEFHWGPNEFFENEILTASFKMLSE